MSTFQIVLIGVFVVFIIAGVFVFAALGGNQNTDTSQEITMWGTVSDDVIKDMTQVYYDLYKKAIKINYVQKDPATFDKELIEILAKPNDPLKPTGAPDVIMLPDDLILRHRDKIYTVLPATYATRTFKDTFIEGGEIFLSQSGITAFPFMVDPMVMYWNRDIFSTEGVANPPQYWDEFSMLVPKLTKVGAGASINRSGVSLGDFRNVTYAKQIISALTMQAGNPIVARGSEGQLVAVLDNKFDLSIAPAVAAVDFFTQFSDPAKTVYSWNRSLPSSFDAFSAGDVGIYIGFASDFAKIRATNPNLNFDVAPLPQVREYAVSKKLTFGRFYGLAILKRTSYLGDSLARILTLTSPEMQKVLSADAGLPPVRRDLLVKKPDNPFVAVFYNSALVSKSWLDPNPQKTDEIFKNIIEFVVSGKKDATEAIDEGNDEINMLLNN